MNIRNLAGVVGALVVAGSAQAWHVECRWVERVGNVDVVLPNNTLHVNDLSTRRLRLQMGVFDDAEGPAPTDGFYAWTNGVIEVVQSFPLSVNTRTPGRLRGFTFDNNPISNGTPLLPDGDPFTRLAEIRADIGYQVPVWIGCIDTDGDGFAETPTPQPPPVPIARNSFVSVYEISTRPTGPQMGVSYEIRASGGAEIAVMWRPAATPIPPDCETGEPGLLAYLTTRQSAAMSGCTVVVQGRTCPCDWNETGLVNSADFFAFLEDFFALNADINRSGTTDSQDFFDFVTCLLSIPAGCA